MLNTQAQCFLTSVILYPTSLSQRLVTATCPGVALAKTEALAPVLLSNNIFSQQSLQVKTEASDEGSLHLTKLNIDPI
jgi:hypothetical protein